MGQPISKPPRISRGAQVGNGTVGATAGNTSQQSIGVGGGMPPSLANSIRSSSPFRGSPQRPIAINQSRAGSRTSTPLSQRPNTTQVPIQGGGGASQQRPRANSNSRPPLGPSGSAAAHDSRRYPDDYDNRSRRYPEDDNRSRRYPEDDNRSRRYPEDDSRRRYPEDDYDDRRRHSEDDDDDDDYPEDRRRRYPDERPPRSRGTQSTYHHPDDSPRHITVVPADRYTAPAGSRGGGPSLPPPRRGSFQEEDREDRHGPYDQYDNDRPPLSPTMPMDARNRSEPPVSQGGGANRYERFPSHQTDRSGDAPRSPTRPPPPPPTALLLSSSTSDNGGGGKKIFMVLPGNKHGPIYPTTAGSRTSTPQRSQTPTMGPPGNGSLSSSYQPHEAEKMIIRPPAQVVTIRGGDHRNGDTPSASHGRPPPPPPPPRPQGTQSYPSYGGVGNGGGGVALQAPLHEANRVSPSRRTENADGITAVQYSDGSTVRVPPPGAERSPSRAGSRNVSAQNSPSRTREPDSNTTQQPPYTSSYPQGGGGGGSASDPYGFQRNDSNNGPRQPYQYQRYDALMSGMNNQNNNSNNNGNAAGGGYNGGGYNGGGGRGGSGSGPDGYGRAGAALDAPLSSNRLGSTDSWQPRRGGDLFSSSYDTSGRAGSSRYGDYPPADPVHLDGEFPPGGGALAAIGSPKKRNEDLGATTYPGMQSRGYGNTSGGSQPAYRPEDDRSRYSDRGPAASNDRPPSSGHRYNGLNRGDTTDDSPAIHESAYKPPVPKTFTQPSLSAKTVAAVRAAPPRVPTTRSGQPSSHVIPEDELRESQEALAELQRLLTRQNLLLQDSRQRFKSGSVGGGDLHADAVTNPRSPNRPPPQVPSTQPPQNRHGAQNGPYGKATHHQDPHAGGRDDDIVRSAGSSMSDVGASSSYVGSYLRKGDAALTTEDAKMDEKYRQQQQTRTTTTTSSNGDFRRAGVNNRNGEPEVDSARAANDRRRGSTDSHGRPRTPPRSTVNIRDASESAFKERRGILSHF